MCYLVAKDINKKGCYAVKTEHGPKLVSLKRELADAVGFDRIQLVTISRPSAYGEYEPYVIVEDTDKFKSAVLAM